VSMGVKFSCRSKHIIEMTHDGLMGHGHPLDKSRQDDADLLLRLLCLARIACAIPRTENWCTMLAFDVLGTCCSVVQK
jgi:hypothetical protein